MANFKEFTKHAYRLYCIEIVNISIIFDPLFHQAFLNDNVMYKPTHISIMS